MSNQNAKNRRDGAKFEADIVKYVRSRSLEADRLRLSGAQDEGDIALRDSVGVAAILEAKAGKNVRPRAWFEEAQQEAKAYALHRSLPEPPAPVLVMKSHNKSTGQALVTMTLENFIDLLGGKA